MFGSRTAGAAGRRSGLLAALACLLCLTLGSCFTQAVWRSNSSDVDELDVSLGTDFEEGRGWGNFLFRVLLTPVALVLDLCTLPLQQDLRDEEEDAAGRSGGC